MTNSGKSDYKLFLSLMILTIFGLIMLASASTALGQARFDDSLFFIKRQILFGALPGFVSLIVLSKVPYTIFKKNAAAIYAIMILFLIAVFIPGIGSTHNTTAQSWLQIGGFSLQPSELAKLGFIIFFSAYLANHKLDIQQFKSGFIPALVVGILPIGLIVAQPDIGTVSILFSILFGMLFVANTKLSHISFLAVSGIGAIISLILVAPYRAARLTIFLHPELDPQGIGYQTSQSLLAIGSGGWLGLGLGRSRQKFQYLPEVHADSIFAIISEEMGFLVSIVFVGLILYILHRLITLAKNSTDDFIMLFASGLTFWMLSQSFLNIGAMIGILPLTGVPLPFVSHGGTALFIILSAMGIALNMSKYAKSKRA